MNENEQVQDNWKDRATGMVCNTCTFFVPKGEVPSAGKFKGRCRRHAPTMNGFPVAYNTDWCGDHKLR